MVIREGFSEKMEFELLEMMEGAKPAVCITGREGRDSECKGLVAGPSSVC